MKKKRYLTDEFFEPIIVNYYSEEQFLRYLLAHFLSEKELQLLVVLGSGIVPIKAANIFGVSRKYIHNYRRKIFKKLNIESEVGCTFISLQCGFINNEGLIEPNTIRTLLKKINTYDFESHNVGVFKRKAIIDFIHHKTNNQYAKTGGSNE